MEGARWLANTIRSLTHHGVTVRQAAVTSQIFLYGHEAFHHIVEAFGTRLEITHRMPLYRTGFDRFYARTLGTDDCAEEALANAHGYDRVRRAFRQEKPVRDVVLPALAEYMQGQPPGYRQGVRYLRPTAFEHGRAEFAERNHKEALPLIASKTGTIWHSFPHAFSGIARVTSRVNYIIHKNSPLAKRHGLVGRFAQ